MEIKERLIEIWNRPYMEDLPAKIGNRGFNFSLNYSTKEILVTGINPSFRINRETEGSTDFDFSLIMNDSEYDNYWTPLKRILKSDQINLFNKSAYLDIFYFRELDQKFLTREILSTPVGISFISEQLNLTQHIIEEIVKPKLIIVKNKESSAYWGKLSENNIIWMGYRFEFVEKTFAGDLFKIVGLMDSNARIAPEIQKTNLENTLVLFTAHINQYTKKEVRPTPELINQLLSRTQTIM